MKSWKQIFLEEYRKCFNVTEACNRIGITRMKVWKEREKDRRFAEAMDEVREAALDLAESALLKAIADGNVTAIIFFLKTQGKHRGYTENDLNVSPVNVKVEFVGTKDEVGTSV